MTAVSSCDFSFISIIIIFIPSRLHHPSPPHLSFGIHLSILLFFLFATFRHFPHTSGRYTSSPSLGRQLIVYYCTRHKQNLDDSASFTNNPRAIGSSSLPVQVHQPPKKSNFTLQYSAEEQDSLPLCAILKFQSKPTLTINQEPIFLPLFSQAGLDRYKSWII